jgi:subtilisin family serine protease
MFASSRSARCVRSLLAAVLAVLGCHGLALAGGGDADREIVVMLKPEADISPLLVKHQLSLVGRFGNRPIFRLAVIGDAKPKDRIKALRAESTVLMAEANEKHAAPREFKNVVWAIGEQDDYIDQWAQQAIRLAGAHARSTGAGVRIAVLDTGVDAAHPALAGHLVPGFDFVDGDRDPSEVGSDLQPSFGHGTHVAGLLAMVAPDARIMPLRILDSEGMSSAWVLAQAMLYAVDPDGDPSTDDGAHVINLSLGTLTETRLYKTVAKLITCKKPSDDKDDKDDKDDGADAADDDSDEQVASVVDRERCKGFGGAVVVAAAGNDGSDKLREYPAAENGPGQLSVAASDRGRWLTRFTNRGWVKIAAPGDGLTSTVPGGGYATWSGTSMAAPLVAGVAALVLAAEPELAVDKVVKRLKDSGGKLCKTGTRVLDAAAALGADKVDSKPACDEPDS